MRGLGIYPLPVSQIHHHIQIINTYTTNITKTTIPNTPLIVEQFLRRRLALHVLLYKNNHSKAARGLPPGTGPTHRPGSRFTRHPCAYTSLSKATRQRTRTA